MKGQFPWLTLAVFVATSAVTAAMLGRPEIGTALQRDPVMLRGEWWRFVTTWFVMTDGWLQIVVNSTGLLVFGTLVERMAGRIWWATAYVVAGLAGEIAGIYWQPVGGGNSVAVCGLIAMFCVLMIGRRDVPAAARTLNLAFWGGLGLWLALRADIHGVALMAGFVVAAVAWMSSRQSHEEVP